MPDYQGLSFSTDLIDMTIDRRHLSNCSVSHDKRTVQDIYAVSLISMQCDCVIAFVFKSSLSAVQVQLAIGKCHLTYLAGTN